MTDQGKSETTTVKPKRKTHLFKTKPEKVGHPEKSKSKSLRKVKAVPPALVDVGLVSGRGNKHGWVDLFSTRGTRDRLDIDYEAGEKHPEVRLHRQDRCFGYTADLLALKKIGHRYWRNLPKVYELRGIL
ncbi:MAG: hypothetical protein WA621_15620, partial [Candidatus Acidiferrum sp.]